MIEDMNVRNFVPATQCEYIRAVKKLAAFLRRSSYMATVDDLRDFQVHLAEGGAKPEVINATVTALRFFFSFTVGKPEATRRLAFVFEPKKLPRVRPPEDVLWMLEAAPAPKSKAMLGVAYGVGLRAMEVVSLKVANIDSQRMLIRVEQGKGRRDRFAMASARPLISTRSGVAPIGMHPRSTVRSRPST